MKQKDLPRKKLIEECKSRLLKKRGELLNQFMVYSLDFSERDSGGDEVDQSIGLINENRLLLQQQRLRHLLLEVEYALSRIETGQYGLCEETQEPIEEARLLAIPWTRVSIEGAEMRETQSKRGMAR